MKGPSLEEITQNFHNLEENPSCNYCFFLIQKAWAAGWGREEQEDFETESFEHVNGHICEQETAILWEE